MKEHRGSVIKGGGLEERLNSHGFPMLRPQLNPSKGNMEGRIRETGVDNGLEKGRAVCN